MALEVSIFFPFKTTVFSCRQSILSGNFHTRLHVIRLSSGFATMSAAEWAEVRQLQALLQNTQQLSTVYNLAERNWVEVVGKLVELGLIDVIHTIDGNEYLTPQHVEREIRNELSDRRGNLSIL